MKVFMHMHAATFLGIYVFHGKEMYAWAHDYACVISYCSNSFSRLVEAQKNKGSDKLASTMNLSQHNRCKCCNWVILYAFGPL
jgi:hypothetical protein